MGLLQLPSYGSAPTISRWSRCHLVPPPRHRCHPTLGDIHRLHHHPHLHHPRQTILGRRTAGIVLHHHSGGIKALFNARQHQSACDELLRHVLDDDAQANVSRSQPQANFSASAHPCAAASLAANRGWPVMGQPMPKVGSSHRKLRSWAGYQ